MVHFAAHRGDVRGVVRGFPEAGGSAKVYLVRIEDLLQVAQSRLTRQLTAEERQQYGLEQR